MLKELINDSKQKVIEYLTQVSVIEPPQRKHNRLSVPQGAKGMVEFIFFL